MDEMTTLPAGPFTSKETADLLGVAPTTVHYWVDQGWLRPSVAHSAIDKHTGLWRVMRFTGSQLRRFVLLRVLSGAWGQGRRADGPRVTLGLWAWAPPLLTAYLIEKAGELSFRRDLAQATGGALDSIDDQAMVARLLAAFAPDARAAIEAAFEPSLEPLEG